MDPASQRQNLVAFYFGPSVATGDVNSAAVINSVANRAYQDLQRTLRRFGSHPHKETLKKQTRDSIAKFVTDLDSCDSQEDFDEHHYQWCERTCKAFEKFSHEGFVFHYGQAQKWLNMTLKYLAVLDHPLVQRVYTYLHIPVDINIFREAARFGVDRPQAAWSTLDREEYGSYQKKLRDMVTTTEYSCPMDWESDVWVTRPATSTSSSQKA